MHFIKEQYPVLLYTILLAQTCYLRLDIKYTFPLCFDINQVCYFILSIFKHMKPLIDTYVYCPFFCQWMDCAFFLCYHHFCHFDKSSFFNEFEMTKCNSLSIKQPLCTLILNLNAKWSDSVGKILYIFLNAFNSFYTIARSAYKAYFFIW